MISSTPSVLPFQHRAFALFWWARMFSALAVQAESVTIGWQVYTGARHSRSVDRARTRWAWWAWRS